VTTGNTQSSLLKIKSSSSEPGVKGTLFMLTNLDQITIHVIDPVTHIKREFKCNKYILQEEMKCFTTYIKSLDKEKEDKKNNSGIKGIDDLEITVHCQIHIFRWLMEYINNPNDEFHLNFKNIHSILMSSDYLDMPKLSEM